MTAEAVGTAFLVMAVVGSGIAAQRLSPDDTGLQLLENSLVTGAALVALILALQPVSASFNPVVTVAERVLGLVTTKRPELEDKDDLKRRIDEAARFVPLDQLALSGQCGFSSTVEGNSLTRDQQMAKLALIVETAEEVWG